MRLLIIATEIEPPSGGMETWLLHLISGLAKRKHRITAIVPEGKDGEEQLQRAGAERVVAVPDMQRKTSEEPATIDRLVVAVARETNIELAHLANTGLCFLVPGLVNAGVPPIVTVHGADLTRPWLGLNFNGKQRSEAYGRFLAMTARVSAVSHFSQDLARAAGAPGDIAVIPPAVDFERFHPGDRLAARRSLGLPDERPIVLSVGRLKPRKGLHHVVSAIPALAQWNPLYAIAGVGEEEAVITSLGCELGVTSQIQLLGHVLPAQLPCLYQAADLFVLPVLDRWDERGRSCEGFGIVYLEAAACGLPCVASRAGGAREAVADGETGIQVPSGNVAALTAALGELLADPAGTGARGGRPTARRSRLHGRAYGPTFRRSIHRGDRASLSCLSLSRVWKST